MEMHQEWCMRFGSEIAVLRAIQKYFRANSGRERQYHDREKVWKVTMWNPTEK
jgi:hypothetical protein